jgi:hypothetical protein
MKVRKETSVVKEMQNEHKGREEERKLDQGRQAVYIW